MNASEKFNALPGNLKGAAILLVAAFGFSIMVLLIKMAGERLHVTQILLVRQSIMLAIILPAILKDFPGCLNTNNPGLQVVRVGFALSAMMLGFTAVIHMPLADATAIGFAKSFFVTIFAIWFLHEKVGPRRWGAVIAGFIGVFVMLLPGTGGFSVYGLYALIGAGCAGVVMVLIRLMSRTDSPTTILSYQALGVGLIMIIPGVWFWQAPTLNEWMLLLGIGGISYLAQMANIFAFKFGEASVLASLDYVRLLYAALFGYLFFSNIPAWNTWLGAGTVIAASIYTVRREAQKQRDLVRSPEGRGYTNT